MQIRLGELVESKLLENEKEFTCIAYHPHLKEVFEIKVGEFERNDEVVLKILTRQDKIYILLDFDRYVRHHFDKDLKCGLLWHKVYTVTTAEELLALSDRFIKKCEVVQ